MSVTLTEKAAVNCITPKSLSDGLSPVVCPGSGTAHYFN